MSTQTSHQITYDGSAYRCDRCHAVSMDRQILDEIPCTRTVAEEPAQPTHTYFNEHQPRFPDYGDVWRSSKSGDVLVFTSEGWYDPFKEKYPDGQTMIPSGQVSVLAKELFARRETSMDTFFQDEERMDWWKSREVPALIEELRAEARRRDLVIVTDHKVEVDEGTAPFGPSITVSAWTVPVPTRN